MKFIMTDSEDMFLTIPCIPLMGVGDYFFELQGVRKLSHQIFSSKYLHLEVPEELKEGDQEIPLTN